MERILKIDQVAWCDEARAMLARSVFKTFNPVSYEQPGAVLLRVCDADQLVGYVVARVDGDEGVIEAATGKLRGVDLTRCVLPAIERLFKGVKAVRLNTARRGLVMKLAGKGGQGYQVTHYTLRKAFA